MTRPGPIAVVTWACVLLALLAADTRSQQRFPSAASSRPNVILIMTDDMGYADLGSYGGKDIKTPPSIGWPGRRAPYRRARERRAVQPTRAALISGRYPQRGAIETAPDQKARAGLPSAARRCRNC
jgi:arylsulfatase